MKLLSCYYKAIIFFCYLVKFLSFSIFVISCNFGLLSEKDVEKVVTVILNSANFCLVSYKISSCYSSNTCQGQDVESGCKSCLEERVTALEKTVLKLEQYIASVRYIIGNLNGGLYHSRVMPLLWTQQFFFANICFMIPFRPVLQLVNVGRSRISRASEWCQ